MEKNVDRVSGLYRIGLQVPEVDKASAFYEDAWSMEPLGKCSSERHFRSRGQDHADLVLCEAETSALDHIALAVETERSLQKAVHDIRKAGGTIVQPEAAGRRPGEVATAVIKDMDGNRIELVVPVNDGPGKPSVPTEGPTRRLGHIVLWTSQIEKQEAFYRVLGFQVSDRSHIGMSFLRCNSDHHSIAFARSGGAKRGLQHVAYDIGSVDDVMREFGRLRESGVECIWGVGRHGPGNNVFSYYRDPAGVIVENYGDMEKVTDPNVGEVKYWGPEHKGDVWGVAGPPPMSFRG